MRKQRPPISRALLREGLTGPADVDFKGYDPRGREVCGTIRVRKPEDLEALLKAHSIYPIAVSEGFRRWLLRWEKWSLALAGGNIAVAILVGLVVRWACGYGNSVSPSPGEAGMAILFAAYLALAYVVGWLVFLIAQNALRRDARKARQTLSSTAFKLGIFLQIGALVWVFLPFIRF